MRSTGFSEKRDSSDVCGRPRKKEEGRKDPAFGYFMLVVPASDLSTVLHVEEHDGLIPALRLLDLDVEVVQPDVAPAHVQVQARLPEAHLDESSAFVRQVLDVGQTRAVHVRIILLPALVQPPELALPVGYGLLQLPSCVRLLHAVFLSVSRFFPPRFFIYPPKSNSIWTSVRTSAGASV